MQRSMGYTIFDTPLIRTLIRWTSILLLRCGGWKTEGALPHIPRFVLIAAPHTSNWDFPIMMFMAFKLKAKIYWMGKHTLFRKPFGTLFRWLGGIPIDRTRSANTVDSMIAVFNECERLVVIIPPSGTRKRVSRWKSGFYHIANGAGIPIVMGFLDYPRKRGGIGPAFTPSGDVSADMAAIRQFYADVEGKYPQRGFRAVPLKKGIPS